MPIEIFFYFSRNVPNTSLGQTINAINSIRSNFGCKFVLYPFLAVLRPLPHWVFKFLEAITSPHLRSSLSFLFEYFTSGLLVDHFNWLISTSDTSMFDCIGNSYLTTNLRNFLVLQKICHSGKN